MKVIPDGTKVKIRSVSMGETLGIGTFVKRGGEGVVISSKADGTGELVYFVRDKKTGKTRAVRREDLIVHHKPSTGGTT
jgi:hypothetical protein